MTQPERIKGVYEIDLPKEIEIRSPADIASIRLFFELQSADCPYGWLPLIVVAPEEE